jgi:hypothetical protein
MNNVFATTVKEYIRTNFADLATPCSEGELTKCAQCIGSQLHFVIDEIVENVCRLFRDRPQKFLTAADVCESLLLGANTRNSLQSYCVLDYPKAYWLHNATSSRLVLRQLATTEAKARRLKADDFESAVRHRGMLRRPFFIFHLYIFIIVSLSNVLLIVYLVTLGVDSQRRAQASVKAYQYLPGEGN